MGIIIDVLILLLFVWFIRKNYEKSQLRCGIETACFVLAAALAVPFSIMLAEQFYNWVFREALANNIIAVVNETSRLETTATNYHRIMDEMPSVIRNASVSYQTNIDSVRNEVERLVMSKSPDAALLIVDQIGRPVIEGIFRATFGGIFFVGLHYLLTSIGAIVENALYTPQRAAQNTVLCSVFGCFKCLVVLSLIVAIIQFVLPTLPTIPVFNTETLGQSFLFRLFYHQNVLMLFLGNGVYPTTL